MLCLENTQYQSDTKYDKEEERLKSFENGCWPPNHVDFRLLARTGMFYIGLEGHDTVKCQFCGISVHKWAIGENPVDVHFAFSENCPLLLRQITRNVPLDFHSLHLSLPNVPDDGFLVIDFMNEVNRIESFFGAPNILHINRQKLAEAGFFYTKDENTVMCFSCGGTVEFFMGDDDPWKLHNTWYKDCFYVRLMFAKITLAVTERQPAAAVEEPQVKSVSVPNDSEETLFGNLFDELPAKSSAIDQGASASREVSELQRQEAESEQNNTTMLQQLNLNGQVRIQIGNATTLANEEAAAATAQPVEAMQSVLLYNEIAAEQAKLADIDVRIATFIEAPLLLREDANRLAEAGFFYTGKKKTVRCFSCGFTEANWRKEYDPWVPHSVMLGQCEFLTEYQWQLIGQTQKVTKKSEMNDLNDSMNLCSICLVNDRTIAFLPCGHMLACKDCADIISVEKKSCPICRQHITGMQKVFFS